MKNLILLIVSIVCININAQGQLNCAGVIIDTPVIISSGIRCGPGRVSLEVKAPIGTGVNWYNDSIGGILLRTNSIYFTMTFLTNNTTYYVEAMDKISKCTSKRVAVKVRIDCNVGFNSVIVNEKIIQIFPNPSHGQFQISIKDHSKSDLFRFQIYDIHGRLIMNEMFLSPIEAGLANYELELAKGCYYINYQLGLINRTEMLVIN